MIKRFASTVALILLMAASAHAQDDVRDNPTVVEVRKQCLGLPESDFIFCMRSVIREMTWGKPGEPYFVQDNGDIVSLSVFLRACTGGVETKHEKCLAIFRMLQNE